MYTIEEIIDARFYDKDGNVIMWCEPEDMRIDVSRDTINSSSLYAPMFAADRRMSITFDVKRMDIFQTVKEKILGKKVDEDAFPHKEFVEI